MFAPPSYPCSVTQTDGLPFKDSSATIVTVILLAVSASGPVASPAAPVPEPDPVVIVKTGGIPSVALAILPESVTLPALSEIDPTIVTLGLSFEGIVPSNVK